MGPWPHCLLWFIGQILKKMQVFGCQSPTHSLPLAHLKPAHGPLIPCPLSKICSSPIFVQSWSNGPWAGHGRTVGQGWAGVQPMKSKICLDFVKVQCLTRVCPMGNEQVVGHGLQQKKSRVCPSLMFVQSLSIRLGHLMLVQSLSSPIIVQSMSRV